MPNSSINTGLAQVPDTTGLNNAVATYHIIQLYNAIGVLQQAIDDYTGNTPPTATPNPPGSTSGSNVKGYATAGVAIAAGRLCGINGAGAAILANQGTVLARGIATGAVAIGAQVELILLGPLGIFAGGSFVPGTTYYLGVGGLFTATSPGVGLSQAVGWALSDTAIVFNPASTFI